MVKQFEIHLIILDPTVGSEMQKTRPCLVVSPDEMNRHLSTVLVAPMTTKRRNYPTRAKLTFNKKKGEVALDQIRAVDKKRLIKKLGKVGPATVRVVKNLLTEMFS